jgi:hypothetical protein
VSEQDLEAIKLTNSIYSILNEDKFVKYTVKQIYDELGQEDFMDYLEKICTKIIKNLDTNTDIKDAIPQTDFEAISYEAETYGEPQYLLVEFIEILCLKNALICRYECHRKGALARKNSNIFTESVYIYTTDVDITSRLKIRINKLYNSGAARNARQQGLGM